MTFSFSAICQQIENTKKVKSENIMEVEKIIIQYLKNKCVISLLIKSWDYIITINPKNL